MVWGADRVCKGYIFYLHKTNHYDRSEEMKPGWFEMPSCSSNFLHLANEMVKDERGESETSLSVVPLHRMWVDDRLWFPLLLSRRRFAGRVDLVDSADTPEPLDTPLYPLVKWWFAALD
jgi:8-oxo-dGTP diphosphatase / 2-hydroxy-dATP diphosphatase